MEVALSGFCLALGLARLSEFFTHPNLGTKPAKYSWPRRKKAGNCCASVLARPKNRLGNGPIVAKKPTTRRKNRFVLRSKPGAMLIGRKPVPPKLKRRTSSVRGKLNYGHQHTSDCFHCRYCGSRASSGCD